MLSAKKLFLSIFTFSAAVHAYDERYRVYGAETINNKALFYREGMAGYSEGSDIITVGKLDGNDRGPFADIPSDEVALTRRWAFLRETSPSQVKYGFKSSLVTGVAELRDQLLESFLPTEWTEAYSTSTYQSAIRTITGQSSPAYYMQDALTAQFESEKDLIRGWLESRIAYLEERSSGTPPVIAIEVANEPNVFPVIPPRLYAWYYLKYRQHVLNQLNSINSVRANSGKPAATVKIMPAGLWIFDGFPASVKSFLNDGISATATITLDARQYPYASAYLAEFLKYLKQPQYIWGTPARSVTISGRAYRLTEFTFENFGNLSGITYMYYNISGQQVGTDITRLASGNYYKIPYQWTARPTTDLIDIGNLHFYPYTGIHASASLSAQLNDLKNLAVQYAGAVKDGKVWLTETGNITYSSDTEVAENLMRPMLTYISASIPEIDRWYWFKNRGEDSKFSMLDGAPTSSSQIANWFLGYTISNALTALDYTFTAIPGFRLKIAPPPAALSQMLDIANSWKSHPPMQGLKDKDGLNRRLAIEYGRLAQISTPIASILSLLLD